MEIELKYSLECDEIAEKIKKDEMINKFILKDSRDVQQFKAVHYDTENFDLQKEKIAYRVRREGERIVATIKWSGTSEGPLHVRNELNINIGTGEFPKDPDIGVFRESEIGQHILNMTEGKKLLPIMEIDVIRESWQIEDEKTILEFCVDKGKVSAAGQEDPISELEVEIITGSEEVLEKYGQALVAKYRLEPEKRSKFARGLALLGKDK